MLCQDWQGNYRRFWAQASLPAVPEACLPACCLALLGVLSLMPNQVQKGAQG